jgi:pimeloyl-ACP methyl ester carboxylesterase
MIKFTSTFKNPSADVLFLENWKLRLEKQNGFEYNRLDVSTSLGNTVVWTINEYRKDLESIVCFPGARTSILYWDLDESLKPLKGKFRIYLVETNGQPNLSDLNSPEINSFDYGHWASEVLTKLSLPKTHIAGASFGGLVCLRLALVAPEKVQKIFLLCPAGIQGFSMSLKNLYYNILPIVFPSRKNILRFLQTAVFCKPNHYPSEKTMELLMDHAEFSLRQIVDKTQKPVQIPEKELKQIHTEVYLFCGENDLLFPGKRTIEIAKKVLPGLKYAELLPMVAHGIEVHKPVFEKIRECLLDKSNSV